VVDYVLRNAPSDDRAVINQAIGEAVRALPDIIAGNLDKAMKELHTTK
jgi:PTH1 family peptidyl-tRNA hydrolase